jgi:hypothetical protein
MASSKSLKRRVSDLVSQLAPELLETVGEVEESVLGKKERLEEVPQSQVNMLSPQQRPSRLHRLSSFLPTLRTDSKPQKDSLRKPVPRKQVPSQYRQSSANPPTRPPPTAPVPASQYPVDPLGPPLHPPHRLHKAGPALPLPAQSAGPHTSAHTSAHTPAQERRRSLAPPVGQSEVGQGGQPRVVSSPVSSRPTSYHSEGEGSTNAISKLRRKSWMPGGIGGTGGRQSRNTPQGDEQHTSVAWVNAGSHKIDYNINLLLAGEKVSFLNIPQFPAVLHVARYRSSGMIVPMSMYIYFLENLVAVPRSKYHRLLLGRRNLLSTSSTAIYTPVGHVQRVLMAVELYLSKMQRATSLFAVSRLHLTLLILACPRVSQHLMGQQSPSGHWPTRRPLTGTSTSRLG